MLAQYVPPPTVILRGYDNSFVQRLGIVDANCGNSYQLQFTKPREGL